jgi:hypothetical protein
MDPAAILLLILGVIVIAVVAYLHHLAEKRRREELFALANELGWQFVPRRDSSHDDQYAHFEVFRRGHSRYAYNTLFGALSIEGKHFDAKMGDFVYKVTSGSGKSRSTTTYRFSYLIVHLPYPGVPGLLIRPEGMFDKLASVLGFDDIDFESAEFSRKFFVGSDNKRFAYDVIDPRMIEFLLDSKSPTVDLEQGRGLFTDGRNRWSGGEFKEMLWWVTEFFNRWPSHVKDTLSK